ncbi:MAG TPA: TonB-dependent receptor [Gemmatimonadales bacterium]|nr:TonB-dependent receptor [Gemmatimonadales bacterium]
MDEPHRRSLARGGPLRAAAAALLALAAAPAAAGAQTNGSIAGHVRQREGGLPIAGAQVGVDGRWLAQTDTAGFYRVREVRSGWHLVTVRAIGFETIRRDSVLVRAGQVSLVNFTVDVYTIDRPVVIEAYADSILDPTVVGTVQRIGGEELRRFPVTTLDEAVALSAGAVGESYRGGRLGQQAFVLDGLGVKNQLDASTGPLGVRIPPDILTEAALVTNGFSARYGQALSGLINVVTKDGGDRWSGRAAFESDRPLWGTADLGLDRAVASLDGPVGGERGARLVAVLDAEGRLDADPVNAPLPPDPRDPRSDSPVLLPHNSGERYDAAVKLRVPLGGPHTLRLFALRSADQRLLYDPAYKYDERWAPARRVTGDLVSAHLQRATNTFTTDIRTAYFSREFMRGTLVDQPPYRFGGVTGRTFRFVGEDMARAQDTALAQGAIPGLDAPAPSDRSPWGVPAFFLGAGSNGEVAWNRYRELRSQVDFSAGGPTVDVYFGAVVSRQRVRTFQRALGYLPVGDSVPPPAASDFSPTSAAAYVEAQLHGEDFVVTLGTRYDQFDPGGDVPGQTTGTRRSINPRFAFSTMLKGATVVASWGRFSQAPDFQYLVDAAFDDTLRTGRFRRGNPNLGFEDATQYEFSVRARPSPTTSLRVNVFNKLLDGLVASVPLGVDPDSTIFAQWDYGNVKGAEVIFDRPLAGGWGVRIAYALQQASATATNAFQLVRRIRIDPNGDTINPARVEFPLDYDRRHGLTVIGQGVVPDSAGVGPLAGLEATAIVRASSGLPFTMTNAAGDTLIGLPNSHRLPPQLTVDMLLRRPVRLRGWQGSIYLDVRNLLNRRNVEAVRRDTGDPGLGPQQIAVLAEQAYQAHPEAIPYESPRYRPFADTDGNGYIEGHDELYPLFLAAARDFTQPLFAYGAPRMFRLGVELVF